MVVVVVAVEIRRDKTVVGGKAGELSRYSLRYESSTLILYKELSSPIFQSCE